MTTVNFHDLMNVGFSEHTSRSIIRQAKIQMVKLGYSVYENKRIGTVPIYVVEKIVGFSLLSGENYNEK